MANKKETPETDDALNQDDLKIIEQTLIKNLEVDETLGQLLVSEGFTGIEDIAQSTPEDISKIEATNKKIAEMRRKRDSIIAARRR